MRPRIASAVLFVMVAARFSSAHAECEAGEDSRSRHVLGLRGGITMGDRAPGYGLGVRYLHATVSCTAPFYGGWGIEAGTRLAATEEHRPSGFDSVYVGALGHIALGHAPPVAAELGFGMSYGKHDGLAGYIYVTGYLSLYYLAGGARYEWGIGRENIGSLEGIVHVPFDGTGVRKF